jgi:hypothetical protein
MVQTRNVTINKEKDNKKQKKTKEIKENVLTLC